MKLEAERLRVDAEERTKQREFELKMLELEASVNAQREQINTVNGSGDCSATDGEHEGVKVATL